MEERATAFANIYQINENKCSSFRKIDLEKPLNFSTKILQQLLNNKTPVLNEK